MNIVRRQEAQRRNFITTCNSHGFVHGHRQDSTFLYGLALEQHSNMSWRSISEISISLRDVQRVAVRVTIDLREMVFAKGDPGIAALYDKLLVSSDLWSFW